MTWYKATKLADFVVEMIGFLVLVLVGTSWAANLNWDPGLTRKDAAHFNLNTPHYWESCITSGACRGVLPPGGGFYTLAYVTEGTVTPCCKPNSGEVITDPGCPTILGQLCAYYFNWGIDFGRVVADTLSYNLDPYVYFGLQENLPTANYGGLPNLNLPAWTIRTLDIQFRTKVCFREPSITAHGTFHYYILLWNPSMNRGAQFRLNLLAFWQTSNGQPPPDNPWYFQKIWNERDVNPDYEAWNLHGQMFGWSPDWSPWIDPTGTACQSSMDNSPWRQWRINLPAIYEEMIAGGYEPRAFFDGAIFSGSIVGGVETWGRSYAALDVRSYYLQDQ